MTTDQTSHIIAETKAWVDQVIVQFNLCPFARREVEQKTIHYHVEPSADLARQLQTLLQLLKQLDTNADIATTLLVLPEGVDDFDDYLDLVDYAERLLELEGYEGVYQLATFHPHYQFADSDADDAANYTNRAPYPMLHVLREESVANALVSYTKPERIPERNVDFARQKGAEFFAKILADIRKSEQ
jgi:hypothetical protein